MKRADCLISMVAVCLVIMVCCTLSMVAAEEDFFPLTTRVQQMGMGDLDMVMFDQSNEVNLYRYNGNVAGLAWDEQYSSLEGNFSHGSGTYTTDYGTKESWSYMGDAFMLYQGLPLIGSMYTLLMQGTDMPSPGGRLFMRQERAVFSLSGGYARYSDKTENETGLSSSEFSYSSPWVNLSAVGVGSSNISFGASLDYCTLKEKYSQDDYGYSYSYEEDYSSIGGDLGWSRSASGSGSFRTSTGAQVHFSSVGPSGNKINFISAQAAHIGGFSVGFGSLRAKVGRMFEDDFSALILDFGGMLYFHAPQTPIVLNLGIDRLSVSDENATSSQFIFRMGAGISVPAGMAALEFSNVSFDEWFINGIEAFKLGGEVRATKPLYLRGGYKKRKVKSYSDIKEDVITAGIGFQAPQNLLSADFAYNNSRETYLMTYDDTRATDHIFAFSVKKGF